MNFEAIRTLFEFEPESEADKQAREEARARFREVVASLPDAAVKEEGINLIVEVCSRLERLSLLNNNGTAIVTARTARNEDGLEDIDTTFDLDEFYVTLTRTDEGDQPNVSYYLSSSRKNTAGITAVPSEDDPTGLFFIMPLHDLAIFNIDYPSANQIEVQRTQLVNLIDGLQTVGVIEEVCGITPEPIEQLLDRLSLIGMDQNGSGAA